MAFFRPDNTFNLAKFNDPSVVAQLDKAVKDYFHSLTQLKQDQDAARNGNANGNRPQIVQFAGAGGSGCQAG